jgi:GxxExxY protein
MVDLIHGELSYKIIGILYKVYNTLGPGFQEKYYQRAIAKVFEKENIHFLEQVKVNFDINGVQIGRYFIDFVVDHRIVLEIKSKNSFSVRDIKQVLGYLKKSRIEVGILAAFSSEGLKIKRILRGP